MHRLNPLLARASFLTESFPVFCGYSGSFPLRPLAVECVFLVFLFLSEGVPKLIDQ